MASKQIADYKFIYDRDNGNQQITVQREYIDTTSGTVLTPLTALFFARVVPDTTKVERPKDLTYRHVQAFIDNPNVSSGVSEMKAYIPYAPGDLNMTAHLREILALTRVLCADYIGEKSIRV